MNKRVLVIGFDPATIDFTRDFFRGKPVTAEGIRAGIESDRARIVAAGYQVDWLLLPQSADPMEAAAALRERLAASCAELVVIGGGIRLDPAATLTFEALVNAAAVAGARLAFNVTPTDTAEAVARGSAPQASSST